MTRITFDEARYVGEWADAEHAHRIGFYLIAGFSMIAFVAALEPLRLANLVAGAPVRDQLRVAWCRLAGRGAVV